MSDTYRIRPLVWERIQGTYLATFLFGKIHINQLVDKSWRYEVYLNGVMLPWHSLGISFVTLKACKLAAEEYYVSRLTGPGGCLERVETTENTQ